MLEKVSRRRQEQNKGELSRRRAGRAVMAQRRGKQGKDRVRVDRLELGGGRFGGSQIH